MTYLIKPWLLHLLVAAGLGLSGGFPAAVAGGTPSATPLVGTLWLLVEIDGKPAGTGTSGRSPDLLFDSEGKVGGYAGCNRFSGGVEIEGDVVTFGPLMSTMMACAEGDQVEQVYLAKLVGMVRFSVSGDELVLYGGDGSRPVLRFRAE
jgi:heat shock protein HslJ